MKHYKLAEFLKQTVLRELFKSITFFITSKHAYDHTFKFN